MIDIKIVCGANFGDEGKGQITDFFCNQATSQNKRTVVVMSNGGAQRGHTVNHLIPNERFVFRHFGSGTLSGADTYCCDRYILNPMIFRDEYQKLDDAGYDPNFFIESNCRWSTPFDMIINQIVERHRGELRHGSCGVGIWETCVRYSRWHTHNIFSFNMLPYSQKLKYLTDIRDFYMPNRLKELGVNIIPEEWNFILYDENSRLIPNFIEDVSFMCNHIQFGDRTVLQKYDCIVFESGQGLLLDQNATLYGDNTTPSNTGSYNASDIISRYFNPKDINVEMCYVTRTYMTRHGAGRFETECSKNMLNAKMYDETNGNNEFQGDLRYGELIIDNLVARCNNDLINFENKAFNWKASIAVTHMNELQMDVERLRQVHISGIYTSDSKFTNSVKSLN